MALIHNTKTLHNFKASRSHLTQLYDAFTRMCEEQAYTDLTLITGDGKAFGVHKVVLVGCSKIIKGVLHDAKSCNCERPTLYLPDFSSFVVKSLLCLLYTGHCEGECTVGDLKPLAEVLKIDLRNLRPDGSDGDVPGIQISPREEPHFDADSSYDKVPCVNGTSVENEIMEVTPEVHNFFGNHFMMGEDGQTSFVGESQNHSDGSPVREYSSFADSSNNAGYPAGSNDGYICRLCGRNTPSPASLFSHLLYPHYAHLWRSEVPQRKQKYDCDKCTYVTKNRQRFIMHIARVHDELRLKLSKLGEDLGVLDNTHTKNTNSSNERIISKIAKMRAAEETEENNPEITYRHDDEMHQKSPTVISFGNLDRSLLQSTPEGSSMKPRLVRCTLCGSWKRRENFFTHMVSVHFRYLWNEDVAKSAPMYYCKVGGCGYETKYRYNLLFHLAGKHKQLKSKLVEEGISETVLVPLEPNDPEQVNFVPKKISHYKMNGGAGLRRILPKPNVVRHMAIMAHQRGGGSLVKQRGHNMKMKPHAKTLICKVCEKISFNHASHRLHVVSKHFHQFWTGLTPNETGHFQCYHDECPYSSNNRQVFIIHLAYVHSELKTKLDQAGKDITLGEPLGKRNNITFQRTRGRPPKYDQVGDDSIAAPEEEEEEEKKPIVIDFGKCKFCPESFDNNSALGEHIALSHFNHLWDGEYDSEENPHAVPEDGPFVCMKCDGAFETNDRSSFILHKVSKHDVLEAILGKDFAIEMKEEDDDNAGPPTPPEDDQENTKNHSTDDME